MVCAEILKTRDFTKQIVFGTRNHALKIHINENKLEKQTKFLENNYICSIADLGTDKIAVLAISQFMRFDEKFDEKFELMILDKESLTILYVIPSS